MENECQESINYSFLVEWFHTKSQDDINLSMPNETHNPFSPQYQKKILYKTVTPFVVIFTASVAVLCFYFVRSCYLKKRLSKSNEVSMSMKRVSIFLTFILLLITCANFWIESELHKGISESLNSIKSTGESIKRHKIEDLIEETKNYNAVIFELKQEFDIYYSLIKNESLNEKISDEEKEVYVNFLENKLNPMNGNITDLMTIHSNNIDVKDRLSIGNLPLVVENIESSEFKRRISGIIAPIFLIVTSVLAAIGIYRISPSKTHSKTVLMSFFLGIVSLAICVSFASLYSHLSVSFSDWCLCPNPYIKWRLSYDNPTDVAYYYVTCNERDMPEIFRVYNTDSRKVMDNVYKFIYVLDPVPKLDNATRSLDKIIAHLVSAQIKMEGTIGVLMTYCLHRDDYLVVLHTTCNKTLYEFANLMLVYISSSFIIGCILFFIVYALVILKNM